MPPPKINYLNNKDLLSEIHKSKTSYCSFVQPEYHQYDIILPGFEKINIRTVAQAKRNRAKRLSELEYNARKLAGEKVKLADFEIDYKKIKKTDLIFRIMTYDHIPLDPLRKKKPKTVSDYHEKVNFPPFQHWKFNDNNEMLCIGKSHWKGDLDDGHFEKNHGRITDNLARMMIKLSERYATKGNVRLYTYNDEMKDQAILQLTQIGLQFDESKSDNPFAYFTTTTMNSFVRVLNIEKRHQSLRDDIMEMNGLTPSYTRASENEYETLMKRYGDDQE